MLGLISPGIGVHRDTQNKAPITGGGGWVGGGWAVAVIPQTVSSALSWPLALASGTNLHKQETVSMRQPKCRTATWGHPTLCPATWPNVPQKMVAAKHV